jgi:long-chain acyl-CoA synthetase
VRDVAVVGVPDAEKGEIVKAVFVMEKGMTLDRRRLDRFTREHLSRHKRPKKVEVLDGDLPRNFLGKVLRRKLRSQENGQSVTGPGTLGMDVPVVLSGSEAANGTVMSEAQRDAF